MSGMALFWVVTFFASALLFFLIAAVAGARGFVDLKTLLTGARRRGGSGTVK